MSNERSIDLHMHSTFSDGVLTPEELMEKAAAAKISTLSLTDHDTTEGLKRARKVADELGLKLIPGIEISAQHDGGTMHILGYFIDESDEALQSKLDEFRAARENRNQKIVDKLQDLGIDIEMHDVLEKSVAGTVGRPHIAQVLLEKGVVQDQKEAFDKYIGDQAIAFVNKEIFNAKEVIEMIHQAGGKAFLAHPVSLRLGKEESREAILKLKEEGLDGLEVYTTAHNRQKMKFFRELCRKENLEVSGGADFHGTKNRNAPMGICHEGIKIQNRWLSSLFQDY